MARHASLWVRDLLLIPLAVGIVIAVVAFVLPKVFADKRELSYTIEPAVRYLDGTELSSLHIEVNGVPTSDLTAYRLHFWNSGSLPVRRAPLRLIFTGDTSFRILSVAHTTKPAYEFGRILDDSASNDSRRFVYELLNPGDEDVVTILATSSAMLQAYSKVEGVRVKEVAATEKDRSFGRWTELVAIGVSVLAALLSSLLRLATDESYRVTFEATKRLVTNRQD